MKVFLSWGGPSSKAAAVVLNEWLPMLIQSVIPSFSPNIEKGTRWSKIIHSELEGTNFGIICLTPENLDNVWVHYEAGALSKTSESRTWTLLLGITPENVKAPLNEFQHTLAEKEDFLKLLASISDQARLLGEAAPTHANLERMLNTNWAEIYRGLSEAIKTVQSEDKEIDPVPPRDLGDMLAEVLQTVKNIDRRTFDPSRHFPKKSLIIAGDAVLKSGQPANDDLEYSFRLAVSNFTFEEAQWFYDYALNNIPGSKTRLVRDGDAWKITIYSPPTNHIDFHGFQMQAEADYAMERYGTTG